MAYYLGNAYILASMVPSWTSFSDVARAHFRLYIAEKYHEIPSMFFPPKQREKSESVNTNSMSSQTWYLRGLAYNLLNSMKDICWIPTASEAFLKNPKKIPRAKLLPKNFPFHSKKWFSTQNLSSKPAKLQTMSNLAHIYQRIFLLNSILHIRWFFEELKFAQKL